MGTPIRRDRFACFRKNGRNTLKACSKQSFKLRKGRTGTRCGPWIEWQMKVASLGHPVSKAALCTIGVRIARKKDSLAMTHIPWCNKSTWPSEYHHGECYLLLEFLLVLAWYTTSQWNFIAMSMSMFSRLRWSLIPETYHWWPVESQCMKRGSCRRTNPLAAHATQLQRSIDPFNLH